jgi:hypothetical protein
MRLIQWKWNHPDILKGFIPDIVLYTNYFEIWSYGPSNTVYFIRSISKQICMEEKLSKDTYTSTGYEPMRIRIIQNKLTML